MLSRLGRLVCKTEDLVSFVVEEVAMADLLDRAWRPVYKKLRAQLSGAIDFKKARYRGDPMFIPQLWFPEDDLRDQLSTIWARIAPSCRRYLEVAFGKGVASEGREPVRKAMVGPGSPTQSEVLLASLEFFYKNHLWRNVIPEVERLTRTLAGNPALDRAAAKKLTDRMDDTLRATGYMGGLANLHVARAHSFGFLEWAVANQVERFRISAILDRRTCAFCEKMHGRTFELGKAVAFRDKFLSLADKPLALIEQLSFPVLVATVAPTASTSATLDLDGLLDQDFVEKGEREPDLALPGGLEYVVPPFHTLCRCVMIVV